MSSPLQIGSALWCVDVDCWREDRGRTAASVTRNQARQVLKARGWSYRSAAPELGVHYSHLCLVLTGKRESRRLLQSICQLPERKGGSK